MCYELFVGNCDKNLIVFCHFFGSLLFAQRDSKGHKVTQKPAPPQKIMKWKCRFSAAIHLVAVFGPQAQQMVDFIVVVADCRVDKRVVLGGPAAKARRIIQVPHAVVVERNMNDFAGVQQFYLIRNFLLLLCIVCKGHLVDQAVEFAV